MNEGGAARRQLRSYLAGAACLAVAVSVAACGDLAGLTAGATKG